MSLSMAGDAGGPAATYAHLAKSRQSLSEKPWVTLVDNVADIRKAKAEGKLAIDFHFQGTESIGRDLANVGAFYKLGVRWMLMAYNFQNNVGVGCIEAETNDGGLSRFGKQLIAEMNRVGMMVDCSHSGHRTTMDAMEASTEPCIFSHSNPRALFDHPRNIRDDQIRALAQTGGVIGVNGVGAFMGEPQGVSVDAMVRQIDYIAQLIGPQHIALGLDYMTPLHCEVIFNYYKGAVMENIALPEELPWKFFEPTDTPQLVSALLDRGYDVDTVRGIMGENFLRVADIVWR